MFIKVMKMSVTLDFIANGKEYEIRRTRTKTTSNAGLYEKIGDRFQKLLVKCRNQ